MKSITRLCFGVASSFLFSIGFGHAAENIDPVSAQLTGEPTVSVAPDTMTACWAEAT